jgi:hypothetical protein
MFYTIYTSSDNDEMYNYYGNSNKPITNGNDNNSCIVCWTTDDYKNRLQYLKDFDEYVISCDCNVLIHCDCLKQWMQTTNSCPICRKKITVNLILPIDYTNNRFNIILYYYICYKYIIHGLKFVSIVYILNLIFTIVYNIYYDLLK